MDEISTTSLSIGSLNVKKVRCWLQIDDCRESSSWYRLDIPGQDRPPRSWGRELQEDKNCPSSCWLKFTRRVLRLMNVGRHDVVCYPTQPQVREFY